MKTKHHYHHQKPMYNAKTHTHTEARNWSELFICSSYIWGQSAVELGVLHQTRLSLFHTWNHVTAWLLWQSKCLLVYSRLMDEWTVTQGLGLFKNRQVIHDSVWDESNIQPTFQPVRYLFSTNILFQCQTFDCTLRMNRARKACSNESACSRHSNRIPNSQFIHSRSSLYTWTKTDMPKTTGQLVGCCTIKVMQSNLPGVLSASLHLPTWLPVQSLSTEIMPF